MHGFWRAAIGLCVGAMVSTVYWRVSFSVSDSVMRLLVSITRGSGDDQNEWLSAFANTLVFSVPVMLVPLLVCLCLMRRAQDHETHCRRCGYILRGIAMPPCPECGERI